MKLFFIFIILTFNFCLAEEPFKPKFYAFQNGARFGSIENEIKVLKELGYDGIAQVGRSKHINKKISAYEDADLKVLSIYLNMNNKPLSIDTIKPFANKNAIIELTIMKESAETVDAVRKTVEQAAKHNIKVALYPHHGFSVATTNQALALIKKVNHPNLGVMFNLCHFLKNEKAEDLETTLDRIFPHLFAVSISGANEKGNSWNDLIKTLDEGTFSQKRVMKKLKQLKFKGPISLQCYGVKGDKKSNLKKSMDAWKKVLAEVQN